MNLFSFAIVSLVCLFACFIIGKIYRNGREDAAREIENEALKQANKAIRAYSKKERVIDDHFDKIEVSLPSNWPADGIIKLQQESESITSGNASGQVPSKRKPNISRPRKRFAPKSKPSGVR